jgi:hypothetical protein
MWTLAGLGSSSLRAQEAQAPDANEELGRLLTNSPEAIPLRNLHRFEKAFLVRACQLSDEQKLELNKLDDSWRAALIKPEGGAFAQAAGRNANAIPGILRVPMAARSLSQNAINDVVAKYRKSLHTQFNELLTPEQRKVYEDELAARDAFKRHTAAEVLVAALDDALHLKPEQRQPLSEALEKWPGKENLLTTYYFRDEGYLPVIPDALLAEHLTPQQLSLYRQTPKMDVHGPSLQGQQEPFGD